MKTGGRNVATPLLAQPQAFYSQTTFAVQSVIVFTQTGLQLQLKPFLLCSNLNANVHFVLNFKQYADASENLISQSLWLIVLGTCVSDNQFSHRGLTSNTLQGGEQRMLKGSGWYDHAKEGWSLLAASDEETWGGRGGGRGDNLCLFRWPTLPSHPLIPTQSCRAFLPHPVANPAVQNWLLNKELPN